MTDDVQVLGGNAQQLLRSYARRLNTLLDDAAVIAEDKKELMKEVKSNGLTPKILSAAVKRMREDAAKRAEEEALVDLYTHAIQGELFDGADDGIKMTMRVGDGPEVGPFTTGDLKRATAKLNA